MPFCPRCRSEYREGFSRCADCDLDLVAERPPAPSLEGWVEIFRGTELQADLACASLEDAGVETLFPDEYASTLGWYAPGSFNAIRVLVKAVDADRAKEILETKPPPAEG